MELKRYFVQVQGLERDYPEMWRTMMTTDDAVVAWREMERLHGHHQRPCRVRDTVEDLTTAAIG